ncbi:uncharacterized protein N0V89_007234 [Didymosphaeria variabile]|uniref:Uncharacterized protein n=1 Tax=Didymosphaeria variabile TaxID=1932322 RepID=A0A9W8XL37_9PLEO|nr:uncharacterized protein N0V89_007234 [Didymosphaeria variabile]KAJ4351890.1 hypothetical protein N0V89_007234 [Didymosphaeria variabile]
MMEWNVNNRELFETSLKVLRQIEKLNYLGEYKTKARVRTAVDTIRNNGVPCLISSRCRTRLQPQLVVFKKMVKDANLAWIPAFKPWMEEASAIRALDVIQKKANDRHKELIRKNEDDGAAGSKKAKV